LKRKTGNIVTIARDGEPATRALKVDVSAGEARAVWKSMSKALKERDALHRKIAGQTAGELRIVASPAGIATCYEVLGGKRMRLVGKAGSRAESREFARRAVLREAEERLARVNRAVCDFGAALVHIAERPKRGCLGCKPEKGSRNRFACLCKAERPQRSRLTVLDEMCGCR
jgi:hypothetical protein